MKPLTVALVVLVGTLSFAAFLVLLAFEPELRRGADGGPDAYSRSAIGFAALVTWLRDQDVPVTVSADDTHGVEHGLLVLTPKPGIAVDRGAPLLSGDATQLVVLPKWDTRRDGAHPGWVVRRGLLDPRTIKDTLAAFAPEKQKPPELSRHDGEARPVLHASRSGPFRGHAPGAGPVRSLQVLRSPGIAPVLTPVLTDDDGGIVLGRIAADIYVLADPDLLNTQGLRDPAAASAALAMVQPLRDDGPVTFDVTLAGVRHNRDLLRTAFEPPFLAATLCLAAAAVLMGLQAARRFGPARDLVRAFEPGKRALASNVAALVALARREHRMAAPYAELTRAHTAAALHARDDAMLDRIARARQVEPPFEALRTEAETARNGADLLRIARKLHAWRQDMLRARR